MRARRVVDAHVHLDERVRGSARKAVRRLLQEMDEAGVVKAVLLQLDGQRWTPEEVAEAVKGHESRILPFVHINPTRRDALDKLRTAVADWDYRGLKLHPRLDHYSLRHASVQKLVRAAAGLKVPVVVDAFPDGDYLMAGHSHVDMAHLARRVPAASIVAAHMGGHHVLDYLMVAKRTPNLHFDCSFSVLYYAGSDVPRNIAFAIRSLKFQRVFYGSDYPDRGLGETLARTVESFEAAGLPADGIDRVLSRNAEAFFPWSEN